MAQSITVRYSFKRISCRQIPERKIYVQPNQSLYINVKLVYSILFIYCYAYHYRCLMQKTLGKYLRPVQEIFI